jgi:hypothetical protein
VRRRRPRAARRAARRAEHPLGAVVHAAGVIDDGTIESLDAERSSACCARSSTPR